MTRFLLIKSHVEQHTRRLASGKMVLVRPYDNKVQPGPDARQGDLFSRRAPPLNDSEHARPLSEPRLLVIRPGTPPKTEEGAPDLNSYDHVLVGFSGGKDSIACVIHLLEAGVPREKIELWHHDVDGGGRNLMDWPITPAYCRAVADALGLPIYFSHREGGIEKEMLRNQTPTAAVVFDTPDGERRRVGGDNWAKVTTREQFPQVGAIASGRWCSGKVKIEVMEAAIRNQPRFDGKRTLVVTGERAEESKSRENYKVFEPHKVSTMGRHVDAWRPVHKHKEAEVWDTLKRYGIVPHPAYQLGYSRLSCRNCIFGDPDQWATNRKHFPTSFEPIADYERRWNKTIHRTEDVATRADKGTPYPAADARPELVKLADQHEWSGPILIDPKAWKLPPGAFKHGSGPT